MSKSSIKKTKRYASAKRKSYASASKSKSYASASKSKSYASASKGKSGATASKGKSGASSSKGESYASSSKGESYATASKGKSGASASKGKSGATASKGKSNATTSKGESYATASKGKSNATTSKGKSYATASKGKSGASSSKGESGASSSKGESYATASKGKSGASSSKGESYATATVKGKGSATGIEKDVSLSATSKKDGSASETGIQKEATSAKGSKADQGTGAGSASSTFTFDAMDYTVALAAQNQILATSDVFEMVETIPQLEYFTGNPPLWQWPRLLVPIGMEALVVTSDNRDGQAKADQNGWADMKLRYVTNEDGTIDADSVEHPPPFSTRDPRDPGVYLHWALPDGLTRGRGAPLSTDAGSSETSEPTDPDNKERAEPSSGETVDFPKIPDRWLVVRMYDDPSDPSQRRSMAWILIVDDERFPSRDGRLLFKKVPLSSWQGDLAQDPPKERWLTAVGLGDPAFAAYFDNVNNSLGFYDDFGDNEEIRGPLSYMVAGWYSNPDDDPLARPMDEPFKAGQAQANMQAISDRFGWFADFDPIYDMATTFESGLGLEGLAEFANREQFFNLVCHGLLIEVPWRDGVSERYPGRQRLVEDYITVTVGGSREDLDTGGKSSTGSSVGKGSTGSSGGKGSTGSSGGKGSTGSSGGKGSKGSSGGKGSKGGYSFGWKGSKGGYSFGWKGSKGGYSFDGNSSKGGSSFGGESSKGGNSSSGKTLKEYESSGSKGQNSGKTYLDNGLPGTRKRVKIKKIDPECLTSVPEPSSIKVTIGSNGTETMAAALAKLTHADDIEPLVTAFQSGMLPVLQEVDGLSQLDTVIHSKQFSSSPGGYAYDEVETSTLDDRLGQWKNVLKGKKSGQTKGKGNTFDVKGGKNTGNAFDVKGGKSPVDGMKVKSKWTSSSAKTKVSKSSKKAGRGTIEEELSRPTTAKRTLDRSRKWRRIKRPMPRYWAPLNPVLALYPISRSLLWGEDGRLDDDNLLMCRVTNQSISSLNLKFSATKRGSTNVGADVTISGRELVGTMLPRPTALPKEVRDLYYESMLLDEANAEKVAELALSKAREASDVKDELENHGADWVAPEPSFLTTFVLAQLQGLLLVYENHTLDFQALAARSGLTGHYPSPIGYQRWVAPWSPLHIDWEAKWYPAPLDKGWKLGECDFKYHSPTVKNVPEQLRLRGRSLLTASLPKTLGAAIKRFLADEEAKADVGDEGEADTSQEFDLKRASSALERVDMLATALGSLNVGIAGREEVIESKDSAEEENPLPGTRAADVTNKYGVRSGFLELTHLRVIDAFGQFVDVPLRRPNDITRSETFETQLTPETIYRLGDGKEAESRPTTSAPAFLEMRPRLIQPSRLMFRLLDASQAQSGDNSRTSLPDAGKSLERGPICGWILPDHLDESLEVYDASGENLGQVQLKDDLTGVEWQGVPGTSSYLGTRPKLPNGFLQGMIDGLLMYGVQDTEAGILTDTRSESALSAFLRMIDATLWTVDPLGRDGDEHLSVLVGRPLALVRARLTLELKGEALAKDVEKSSFDVRLGDLTRLSDGLIGYYVDDDYTKFYPVHEDLANRTPVSGPREDFTGPAGATGALSIRPVVHPYINEEPFVSIAPGQTRLLTLVVDPRGAVHATSGILPRKRIELLREHVAEALERMSVTFRVGPVLSNPEELSMPLPAEIRGDWSWIQRTGVSSWKEGVVGQASADAKLSKTPSSVVDGWLKLSSAMGEGGD